MSALREDPLGPPLYWLLPRQATFDAERALTCGSGLGGFTRARVVSFGQLGREIAQSCGASGIPEVTPIGRQMVIGHLLRRLEAKLQFYGGVARQAGLAAELDLAFAEWERAGHGADEFGALVRRLEKPSPADGNAREDALSRKMHDLRLLYEAYTAYLGQERLDQHRRTNQVLSMLDRCTFLPASRIYVDGFAAFTAHERKLLAGVAQAGAAMEICLLLDPQSRIIDEPEIEPDEMSLFHRTEGTYRRLVFACRHAGVEMTEPVRLRDIRRLESPALAHLERGFCCNEKTAAAGSAGITLIEASSRRAEVDSIARTIQGLLVPTPAGPGMRFRDIALLARNLTPYKPLLASSFDEHGIPFFADQRRSGLHHPILKSLRSLFQIARSNWRHDAVISFLKAGLAGVSAYEADEVENYVLAHGLIGASAWEAHEPWMYHREASLHADDLSTGADFDRTLEVDRIRRQLAEKLRPFLELAKPTTKQTVRAFAVEIFATFDRFQLRQTMATWIAASRDAGDFERAAEHEQIWSELKGLFEQMVALLGDETMSLDEFVIVLEAGLDQFDLALTPPTVDQVLVGQVDRTRSPDLKVCFVLGLNEGEFPAPMRDSAILSDRERRALHAHHLQLDPDVRRRALDERLLGYIALTRASHHLYLTRPTADDNAKAAAPSPFWREVLALDPSLKPIVANDDHADPATVATPRQLVTSLMNWVREPDAAAGAASPKSSAWPALYHWLAAQPCDGQAVDLSRYHGWRALAYSNTSSLSSAYRNTLFPRQLDLTAKQLETFAQCPFRHFAHESLGLRPRERQSFSPGAMGRVYHQILARLFSRMIRGSGTWDDSQPPIDQEMIRDCTRQVSQKLRHELMLGTARSRYLLQRAERMLGQFVQRQFRLIQRGQFRPVHANVSFGGKGKLPPLRLTTPGGARVSVRGNIDRIDRVEGTGHTAVFDYKLSASAFWIDGAYHGLALQLLTALLMIEASAEPLAGQALSLAAAFYLPIVRKFETVDHPGKEPDPTQEAFWFTPKPRGLFDSDRLLDLDRNPTKELGAFAASIRKDGELGAANRSDAIAPENFAALLQRVRDRITDSADQILSGNIAIAPYRLNDKSPCSTCDYADVCRFHPLTNRYRKLPALGRKGVFDLLGGGGAAAEGR